MTAKEFWDFCHLPENETRSFELVRGEVVELSRPTKKHGRVYVNIAFALESYARRVNIGYVVSNDSGVILEEDPDTVVGPDVAFYTDANKFDDMHPKWGEEPPILAVEVLSPNDKVSKTNSKMADYLKNRVKLVWLVDYEERKVTVFRPDWRLDVLGENQELTGNSVLPGFSCHVGDFFRMPGETTPSPAPPVPPSA
ncbi:hypothetical protein FRUB_00690 [Fimbriiglobus ruber]|uniref:Putative restriction endonuclease domain-containing protein n=2 Tax=Fimbriiglobus ruber TaxID=1908690 RepID=A0A225E064_9BACT|nr:hypothetical protein FRUB_00690 [Fimbriiglobus ruber]